MRPWYVCPRCGSSLDPGERCDCIERPLSEYCAVCEKPLYGESYLYDQDDCYEIEKGEVVCEDCISKYVLTNYRKIL